MIKFIAVFLWQTSPMWHCRTKKGIFLRFDISEVPEKKKTALGVRGIKLSVDDAVEEVYLLDQKQ